MTTKAVKDMNDVERIFYCVNRFREMGLTEDASRAVLQGIYIELESMRNHKDKVVEIVDSAYTTYMGGKSDGAEPD